MEVGAVVSATHDIVGEQGFLYGKPGLEFFAVAELPTSCTFSPRRGWQLERAGGELPVHAVGFGGVVAGGREHE